MTGRLAWSIERVGNLHRSTCDAMWDLYRAYYADVDRSVFDTDLAAKNHVILLRDAQKVLRGFSTLVRYPTRIGARRALVVFSGDTVVDRPYWGDGALQHGFGAYMVRTTLAHPFTPTYWFLISKGYKTYLLLTRNFKHHWPRHEAPTPVQIEEAIRGLAQERFGSAYDPGTGTIRFSGAVAKVREGVAPIHGALLTDPAIRFFQERNPRHAEGEELACLGKVDWLLWPRFVARRLRRRTPARAGPAALPAPRGSSSQRFS